MYPLLLKIIFQYHTAKSGFDFRWKYHKRDVAHLGDCDVGVEELASLLGWKVRMMICDKFRSDDRNYIQEDLERLYIKGNANLKAQWEAYKEEEEEEPSPTEEPDQEVEALAEELEKRLKVPSSPTKSEKQLEEKEQVKDENKIEQSKKKNKQQSVEWYFSHKLR